jgi:hypothetical protein
MLSEHSLLSKTLRYLSFAWLLKTPEGELFQKAAAQRHNRQVLKRWLPHYLRVHATLLPLSGAALWAVLGDDPPGALAYCAALWCGAEFMMVFAILGAMVGLALEDCTRT